MPLTNGTLTRRYDERVQPGRPRLGRHMELDARSLAFLAPEARLIKSSEWLAPIPTLDQGRIGSCVGNAATNHVAALYGAARLSEVTLDWVTLSATVDDEPFAVRAYHDATIYDGFPGIYPPDDTGSSGLGVCRAFKHFGLIAGYTWATTARGFASLLQSTGCIIGMPWRESFFAPDANGFIDSGNWQSSEIAGGHEVYVEALEAWDEHDDSKSIIRVHNSWGSSWGDHGRFRMRLSTYRALKKEIDVKQFKLA